MKLGVVLVAVLLAACAPPPLVVAEKPFCDCAAYAYNALKVIDTRVKDMPSVIVSSEHGGRGFYVRGVIGTPDINNCNIFLHELVHHYQYRNYGEAKTPTEVWLNEVDAQSRAFRAKNLMGECR